MKGSRGRARRISFCQDHQKFLLSNRSKTYHRSQGCFVINTKTRENENLVNSKGNLELSRLKGGNSMQRIRRICFCTHKTTLHHNTLKNGRQTKDACDMPGCKCQKFRFSHNEIFYKGGWVRDHKMQEKKTEIVQGDTKCTSNV